MSEAQRIEHKTAKLNMLKGSLRTCITNVLKDGMGADRILLYHLEVALDRVQVQLESTKTTDNPSTQDVKK